MATEAPHAMTLINDCFTTAHPDSSQAALQQIRQILFGQQMAAIDSRLERMEARLLAQSEQFRLALEQHINTALTRLDEERLLRQEEHRGLLDNLDAVAATLRAEQGSLSQEMQQDLTQVRDELYQQGRELVDRMAGGQTELAGYLRELASKLENGPGDV